MFEKLLFSYGTDSPITEFRLSLEIGFGPFKESFGIGMYLGFWYIRLHYKLKGYPKC